MTVARRRLQRGGCRAHGHKYTRGAGFRVDWRLRHPAGRGPSPETSFDAAQRPPCPPPRQDRPEQDARPYRRITHAGRVVERNALRHQTGNRPRRQKLARLPAPRAACLRYKIPVRAVHDAMLILVPETVVSDETVQRGTCRTQDLPPLRSQEFRQRTAMTFCLHRLAILRDQYE